YAVGTSRFTVTSTKELGTNLRDLLISEEPLARDGQYLITTERDDPARIRKLERVHAEIRQGSVAHWRRLRRPHESLHGRMSVQEFLDRRWLVISGFARI